MENQNYGVLGRGCVELVVMVSGDTMEVEVEVEVRLSHVLTSDIVIFFLRGRRCVEMMYSGVEVILYDLSHMLHLED